MRKAGLFFLFVFFSLFFSLALAENIPELKECESLVLRTSQGWWLRINKDGSGSYGYGVMIDRAEVKQEAFNFGRIYEEARKASVEVRTNAEGPYVAVSYYVAGQSSAREYYVTRGTEWAKNQFLIAREHTIPASNEIEKRWQEKINDFWKKNPPFSNKLNAG